MDTEPQTDLEKYIDDVTDAEPLVDDPLTIEDINVEDGDVDPSTTQQTQHDQTQGTGTGNEQQPASQQAKGKQQEQGAEDAVPQLRPLNGGAFADAKGNITDSKGNIIAEAGFAARIHQTGLRQKQTIADQESHIQRLTHENGDYKALTDASRSYGLVPEEMARAVDMAGRIKSGGILGVTKEVLAMALAEGHNATDILGTDVGDSIEMRAVRSMIDEIKGPQIAQQRQQDDEAAVVREATTAMNEFLSNNTYAHLHGAAIVSVGKANNMNPQQAYNAIVEHANKLGMDISKPLQPQFEARERQRAEQKPGQQQHQKPMPHGASTRTPGANASVDSERNVPVANADDSWRSIIDSALNSSEYH